MSESPPFAHESAEASPTVQRRSSRWQLGLQRLILLIAAIAVWMTVYLNRQQNALLDSRIKVMVPLAHELIVDDPSKVAVVNLEPLWMDDDRWDLSLPAGSYRLCLATRKIDENGVAPVFKSAPIRSGRHRLALMQERGKGSGRATVTEDKNILVDVHETMEWDPGVGSQGGGQFSLNEQLPPDKPIILYRRRFMQPIISSPGSSSSQIPKGPTTGILLWIERVIPALHLFLFPQLRHHAQVFQG